MRPRCSVFIATSLDGFIARPDGRIDWLAIVERPGEDYGFKRFFDSVDTLAIGRKTYDTALSFADWPYVGKRCVVLTHAPPAPKHGEESYRGSHGEELCRGSPESLLDRLGGEGQRHVYVDGGAVIRQFLAAGLVTDMTISIVPILLGNGIPLFGAGGETGETGHDARLELVASHSFPSGLAQLEYRVAAGQPEGNAGDSPRRD